MSGVRRALGALFKTEAGRRAKEIERQAQLCRWFDMEEEDVGFSEKLLMQPAEGEKRIRWLLCNFTHPYGGVFTALRIADHMESRGWKNEIVVYDAPDFSIEPQWETAARYFPHLKKEQFFAADPQTLPPVRAAVATFWTSAYALLKLRNVREKYYLIQDYEPAFYPAGTEYALAENTYRMPFHRIYNTKGLADFIEGQYPLFSGARSMHFTPAVDERYRFVKKPLTRPVRVLFYARPDTPRNAFSLMLAFARALKKRYGERVSLTAAGAAFSKEMRALCGGVFEFSEIQPYESLPAFYASFHFVVCFMLTKHPSYLPLEAMACGCAVLTNKNGANNWLLRDGENCLLTEAAVTPLMHAFSRGLDEKVYERITAGGRETVERFSWAEAVERTEAFFENKKIEKRG